MPLQSLPDFDAQWDYSHPDQTEAKFCEILRQFPEEDPAFLELLTQIARAQGLQQKFEHAHQTLDQVQRRLEEFPSRPKVRYLLERGRVFNSSGEPEQARPLFEQAFEMAKGLNEDSYAVDALHMLAILASPGQSLDLNRQAINWQNYLVRRKRATGLARFITTRAGRITTWAITSRRWRFSRKPKRGVR